MERVRTTMTLLAWIAASVWVAAAQSQPVTPASDLVNKSVRAVSYQVGGGSTQIDLTPSGTVAGASGEATIQAKQGVTNIEVAVKGMDSPTKIGAEFLTYVLWVVSPDGRFNNVGEIQPDQSGQAKLKATAASQTFSLFVSAEPYFAVRQPSEVLVLINDVRKNTKGKIVVVDDYKLMRRSQYAKLGNPLSLSLDLKNVPLEMYEARNAVEIAKSRNAEKYAPEIFSKADGGLKLAEAALARKSNKKDTITTARMAVQSAEDARALAVQRQDQERIANEKAAAAAKAKSDAEAKAAAEAAETKRKTDEAAAEARRRTDEAAARAAQEAKRQAEIAAAREAQLKAEQDSAALRAKMEADTLRAKEEAAKAEAERARQATEALRAQLLSQLNSILETKDTPRGLVVTMADVLFDTGKYDLRPATREKLAQLSGIILGHPGLTLRIEGYTDSTGSDELNQKLSEQRAGTVRDYLSKQGLAAANISAVGFGKDNPVADNSTAAGRKQNRRVEIVLSGEVIGVKIDK